MLLKSVLLLRGPASFLSLSQRSHAASFASLQFMWNADESRKRLQHVHKCTLPFKPRRSCGTCTTSQVPVTERVCVRLATYTDNVALLALARHCCRNRAISPACHALRIKPIAAALLLSAYVGTDGRTDTVPFHKHCSAYYAGSANKWLE